MQKPFVRIAVAVALLSLGVSAQTSVYSPGNGVTAPRVVHKVRPVYPAAAEREHRQGKVMLAVVVNADGVVSEIAVTETSADEFTDAAVAAAWQYQFKPGIKDGQPVSVRVPLEVLFTLH